MRLRSLGRGLAGLAVLVGVLPLVSAQQQTPTPPGPPGAATAVADEGIPVTDPEVVKACGSCHIRGRQDSG